MQQAFDTARRIFHAVSFFDVMPDCFAVGIRVLVKMLGEFVLLFAGQRRFFALIVYGQEFFFAAVSILLEPVVNGVLATVFSSMSNAWATSATLQPVPSNAIALTRSANRWSHCLAMQRLECRNLPGCQLSAVHEKNPCFPCMGRV
jgi:hypothetical protein